MKQITLIETNKSKRQKRIGWLCIKIQKYNAENHERLYKPLFEIYTLMKKDGKCSINKVAKKVGMVRQTVQNILSWRYASLYVKQLVNQRKFTRETAANLLGYMNFRAKNHEFQDDIFEHAYKEKLSLSLAKIYLARQMNRDPKMPDYEKNKMTGMFIRDFERNFRRLKILLAQYNLNIQYRLRKDTKEEFLKRCKDLKKILDDLR